MRFIEQTMKPLLVGLAVLLLISGVVEAAEPDDAGVFVDAFAAYQKKDYLLALEKVEQLNRQFPDTPLRDVVLLLSARSSHKAGDNEKAAKSVTTFINEFPESTLRTTIEEELLALSNLQRKGDTLPPNKKLQAAAQKVRSDRLAQERLAAAKLEQERLAKEKNERELVAREKAEAERRARELAAAEKAAKESIKVVVNLRDGGTVTAVGENGSVPIEISNRGKKLEEFVLETVAPPEFGALITAAANSEEKITRIKLAAGESFKGSLTFRMPFDKLDGTRSSLAIKAVSAVYSDVVQQKNAVVITSAPLVRVVARLSNPGPNSGEQLRYKVSLLNIGSMAARMLTVRIQLPAQLDFQGAQNLKFQQEKDGSLAFKIEKIEIGNLSEVILYVKQRNSDQTGNRLLGQVEVVNGQLQHKEIFSVNIVAAGAAKKQ